MTDLAIFSGHRDNYYKQQQQKQKQTLRLKRTLMMIVKTVKGCYETSVCIKVMSPSQSLLQGFEQPLCPY